MPVDIWCPNCGVPQSVNSSLKAQIDRGKTVVFFCRACGLKCEISKLKKKKKNDEINLKKVIRTGRDVRALANLVGKL